MKKIEIKNTSPEFIKSFKLELAAKKERMDKYFKMIKDIKTNFKIGDKVIKNEDTWEPNDFDSWGRGIGVGEIVEPPFELDNDEVDVRWPSGRCFEMINQIKRI